MNGDEVRIPTSSQTVGPYFRIGLEYLLGLTPELAEGTPGTVELHGCVWDRDGAPVPDAMLEFWSRATVADGLHGDGKGSHFPAGFRRAATGSDGTYRVVMERPLAGRLNCESPQAPHMLVLVFARGLLRHLISRVYLADELANDNDPVLMTIPKERRATLIAQPDWNRTAVYRWDVVLQGTEETVFFAW